MNRPTRMQIARWAALAAVAAPLAAQAASGEFTFVTGEVTLVKASGQRVTPTRGTAVDPGDRIVTGANGMVQLTMVDNARLSLRPSTQFLIEQYAERRDSEQGGVLNLIKGTLRAFTGLIAATNRDKFVMKTRVATVGIRGSGNILHACDPEECDASVTGGAPADGPVTVNHTIEGAHAVTNILADMGLPAQQGGAQTLITGPGQTVLVVGGQAPRYIPTPAFIANAATNMTGAKVESAAPGGSAGETRNFSPSDAPALPPAQIASVGPGFTPIDATGNLASGDPLNLRDVVLASSGSPFLGQSVQRDVAFEGNEFRGYRAYAGTGSDAQFAVSGGTAIDPTTVNAGGVPITFGRHREASLGFFGGTAVPVPGSIHWIVAPSGYPAFLGSVLTGTATYTLIGATSPTNQNNVAGTLGSAVIDANFGNRTLDFRASVTIPTQGAAVGGSWDLAAQGVPITLNTFFASTADRLVIRNGVGQESGSNDDLSGSFEGSFVGTGLPGAIVGYGIRDTTAGDSQHWHFVSGVAAFQAPPQDGATPFREGRISDATGALTQFVRSYATTVRPEEVSADAQGAVTAFSAPFAETGTYSRYELGTAQVVQSGFDPATGMVWGRWGGGTAVVGRGMASRQVALDNTSLHYIFAGTQSGPVTLPLTGVGVYDVIGATSPTDMQGHVGTFNSATLNANFTNRTVDASVNIGINGQTWTGSATGMPIYRDQYFSAYSGNPIPGLPNPAPLMIGCTPNCGQGASGSFDGFFTGSSGQGAGMIYNLGGNQGAIAFGRRGGP